MLLAILIYALHGAIFGHAARRVSEYRGEPDGFWWGFWLGAPGLLIVIFRKSVCEKKTVPPAPSAPRPNSASTPKKICPSCGARNNIANTSCFACGKPFEN